MIERILIPLDGSDFAEAILPQVRRFLKQESWEVVLFEAIPSRAPDFHFAIPGHQREAHAYIRKRTFELINEGISARGLVKRGYPASMILQVAHQEQASMIAMSTHGRRGLERLVLGSVAEKVLRASPVPVLLVRSFAPQISRGQLEDLPFRHLLVPLDGSESSSGIIPLVLQHARPLDARVTLLHVVEGDPLSPHHPPEEKAIVEARRALTDQCIPTTLEILRGDPALEILRFAEREEMDLIIMSSHGRSGPVRWVLGSVAEKVLREATVPMIVARRAVLAKGESPGDAEAPVALPPI